MTGRLFHVLITRLLKKVHMTELEHLRLLSVYESVWKGVQP